MLDPFIIMIITSKSNRTVKYVASLKNKKARRENGVYVVEGVKMVSEALSAGKTVETLVFTESMQERFRDYKGEVLVVSDSVFGFISDEVTPQGVLAVLKTDKPSFAKANGVSVLLDGVSDPGNLGTIFRTSAAIGVKNIYLVNCCDPYSPKTVRSSMSGIFHVNVIECGYEDALTALDGVTVLVGDMSGENVFKYDPPADFCIVIGNEANGVGEVMRKRADKTLKIPMSENVESLNAGVSLSVMLYELTEGKNRSVI